MDPFILVSFNEVLPLIDNLLSKPSNGGTASIASHVVATNDRLLQLLIKGILYESCVDYCQQKATGSSSTGDSIQVSACLSQLPGLSQVNQPALVVPERGQDRSQGQVSNL